MQLKHIGVFYNQHKAQNQPLAQQAVDFLRAKHIKATMLTSLDNLEDIDLVISMGGDGTMLRCARECAPKQIPIFGINCGTLGFLAAAEKEELTAALDALLAGKYISHKRLLLQAVVKTSQNTKIFTAFNDVVLHSANLRTFYVNATFNGTKMPSYFGDGVIVSTPTGSTAYSLAAGGPIVEPNVEVIVITPICPHSLHQRPMVLPATGLLQLSPSFKNKEDGAIVSFDGQLNLPLEPGAVLELSRAPHAVELLTLPQRGFFDVLHKKLSWGKEEC
jgi:NAD+ kinase